jgi:hypothetical protein
MACLIGHAPSGPERVLVTNHLFGNDPSVLVEGVSR